MTKAQSPTEITEAQILIEITKAQNPNLITKAQLKYKSPKTKPKM